MTVSPCRCDVLRLQSLGPAVQEAHGVLDPLLVGVCADLLVPFGLEAVGQLDGTP